MRIALVVDTFPALSQTFVLHQVTGLLDLGHDVRIISRVYPDEDVLHPDVEEYDLLNRTCYLEQPGETRTLTSLLKQTAGRLGGGIARKLLKSLPAMGRFAGDSGLPTPAMTARIREVVEDCDLVHCHFGPSGLTALEATRSVGLPLLVTFHGYDVGQHAKIHGAEIYSELFAHGHAFMCVSEYLLKRVVELGASPEAAILQYITSSIEDVPFSERRREDDEPIRLLSVARLIEKKGLRYSIEAVGRLASEGHNVEYSIAGDGPLYSTLDSMIRQAGLQERVTLHGLLPRPEILRLLQRSHIFVLTSVTAPSGDTEGMPVVLREAHASGLPVITTDHAGNPEAIEDGVSGFVIPERDVDSLVERLQYLIAHSERWPEMGRAGRTLVEERFDVRRLNERLVCVYENVLAGRPPGDGLS